MSTLASGAAGAGGAAAGEQRQNVAAENPPPAAAPAEGQPAEGEAEKRGNVRRAIESLFKRAPAPEAEVFEGLLEPEAYEEARAAAPGWDVRHLEGEWRRWCAAEEIEPKHPSRHFVRFCQSWFEKRGRP